MVTILAIVTPVAPVHGQSINREPTRRHAGANAGLVAPAARGGEPTWLDQAIRTSARVQADGLTQTTPGASPSGHRSCAKRIVLFTLLGTGVSVGAAGILLASTGGSDDTNGILTRWALLGVGVGSVVGALTCLAP